MSLCYKFLDEPPGLARSAIKAWDMTFCLCQGTGAMHVVPQIPAASCCFLKHCPSQGCFQILTPIATSKINDPLKISF